ncbi:MAG: TSUP family transporter [Clostridiales bacterium]|nr:TSUP family transporter [Clostridiales bacterium]
MKTFILPLLVGFGTGILSAWGVGGGTLLLLCMTLFLGVDQRTAQGINLLYFLPTAGVSLLFLRKNGRLAKQVLLSSVPLGVIASVACSFLATSVDVALLKKPFGLFLLFAGILTLFQKRGNS